jgi:hypothetical protein
MKFFAAVAALVVAAVANAQSPPFTSCATGTPDLTVTGFSLAPYPLNVGGPVSATVTGTLVHSIIAPARLSIIGRYAGRVVYTDSHDLCTLLASSSHPCPVTVIGISITIITTIQVLPTAPVGVSRIKQPLAFSFILSHVHARASNDD